MNDDIPLPAFRTTPSKAEILARSPMPDYLVFWREIRQAHVLQFEQCLKSARVEQDLQRFFEKNPILLIQHLGGGHGRWVIPRQRLGAEYVTDFLIAERS